MKILHIINFKCDKHSKRFDVSGMSDEEIEKLRLVYYKRGINFTKIVEE